MVHENRFDVRLSGGCYGAKDLHTPHTDALAARGVRFTQFYSGAPVCSQSRACLLTGRYPVRGGVPGNCGSQRGGKGALPETEVTLAEMFKVAGYATAHMGKWHLGYAPETQPNAQGFDHSFGHIGGCIDNYSHVFYWSGPNIHLANLRDDPGETTDLADQHPDVVARLRRLHEQHLE